MSTTCFRLLGKVMFLYSAATKGSRIKRTMTALLVGWAQTDYGQEQPVAFPQKQTLNGFAMSRRRSNARD